MRVWPLQSSPGGQDACANARLTCTAIGTPGRVARLRPRSFPRTATP